MAIQHSLGSPFVGLQSSGVVCSWRLESSHPSSISFIKGSSFRSSKLKAYKTAGSFRPGYGKKKKGQAADMDTDDEDESSSAEQQDAEHMDSEERREWREKIREVVNRNPNVEEEFDNMERRRKMQKLLADYPLVVEEEDPDWPEDSDGWGFNLGQFFDKITIKNKKKDDKDDDDDKYDSDNEVVWQDDNYIRPIKDITTAEWEEAVFKDISPLIVLVHNRYKRYVFDYCTVLIPFQPNRGQLRKYSPEVFDTKHHRKLPLSQPKDNEKIREELEKAIHIIWNCNLPSPRCVAVDAVVERNLVSALRVQTFPEIIFTKAGKILYREKGFVSADELSKIMAFFYYGAAKPPCLKEIGDHQETIPSVSVDV